MRILVVTPNLPWPLNSGGNAAQYAALKCLAADHQFVVIAPAYRASDLEASRELARILPEVRVQGVFCGVEGSVARRAATHAVRIGRRFLDGPRLDRAHRGVEIYNPFSPLPRPLVQAVSDELKKGCDLFQGEYAEALQLAPWIPRPIPRLLIHLQPHAVVTRRAVELGDGNAYSAYLESIMQVQETAYLREFDAVIAFSETDRDALASSISRERIFVSPFPVPPDVPVVSNASGKWDGRFVFLGAELHHANRDALPWLFAEVWPAILSQVPNSKLEIVGEWSRTYSRHYGSSNVRFAGFVDNLQATLMNAILLVPIRIGSGIRAKILAAMASGIPVISTGVGSEGLPITNGMNILTADEPGEFATAALALATTADLRQKIAAGGLAMIKEFYTPESVRRRRNEVYRETVRLAKSP